MVGIERVPKFFANSIYDRVGIGVSIMHGLDGTDHKNEERKWVSPHSLLVVCHWQNIKESLSFPYPNCYTHFGADRRVRRRAS